MDDKDRIARLEFVLGTLITWLNGDPLSTANVTRLIGMLQADKPRESSVTLQ